MHIPFIKEKMFVVLVRRRAHLHQASASMQSQCWHDTSVVQLSLKSMERVTKEWGCNPFWSNSILFNEGSLSKR